MISSEKLFSSFLPTSKAQWKAKAMEDLKGADFDKKLTWHTDDGFVLQPFYTAEDLHENPWLKQQHSLLAKQQSDWTNYTEILVENTSGANAAALEMMAFGATGLLFVFKDEQPPDFAVLLKDLNPQVLHISFATAVPSPAFLTAYFSFLTQQNIPLQNIRGFYAADLLEHWSTTGTEPVFDALATVIKTVAAAPGFKALTIQSQAFLNAGANSSQEIAFTLNKLTDYFEILQSKGITADVIANNLLLHFAIGGDYFFEIAKLRAVRLLLKIILQQYGIDVPVTILSSNAIWSKTFYDANVNLLRNTTEAMSAILGGCNALLVIPHDASFEKPAAFGRRIALNVSNILKEEAYFDKVADPAGGSYYLESLTGKLAENALQLFKENELAGGFIQLFKKGIIQQQIRAVKQKKETEIALRRRVYVGTNKYPNPVEKMALPETAMAENATNMALLIPQRAALAFELLRSKTLRHFEATGFLPKILPACFGNPANSKARAAFATDFFGSAGFQVLAEYTFTDLQKAAADCAASNADIIVLCAADTDYVSSAPAFTKAFSAAATNKLLMVAGYPENIVEELSKAGVNAFIHLKSNAIELLAEFQQQLFGNT